MKFEEIFEQDGLYTSDSFHKGVALKITDGVMYTETYKNENDISPKIDSLLMYKGLFSKEYTKVLTRQSLFKK